MEQQLQQERIVIENDDEIEIDLKDLVLEILSFWKWVLFALIIGEMFRNPFPDKIHPDCHDLQKCPDQSAGNCTDNCTEQPELQLIFYLYISNFFLTVHRSVLYVFYFSAVSASVSLTCGINEAASFPFPRCFKYKSAGAI